MGYEDSSDDNMRQMALQVSQRINQFNEQLCTLARVMGEFEQRLIGAEKTIKYSLYTQMHASRYISLISEELNIFEKYVSKRDPKLMELLKDIDIQKQEEIKRIKEQLDVK